MAAIYPATLSPRLLGSRDRDGFPPKGTVTFGEVVSSFNKCGNSASKRHGALFLAPQTRLPNSAATLQDRTVNFLPPERDCLRWSTNPSARPQLTARSRTPSPWAPSRRPQSLPATPRGPPPLSASPMTVGKRLVDEGLREWPQFAERSMDRFGGVDCGLSSRGDSSPLDVPPRSLQGSYAGGALEQLHSPGICKSLGPCLYGGSTSTSAAGGAASASTAVDGLSRCGSDPVGGAELGLGNLAGSGGGVAGAASSPGALGSCPTPRSPVARCRTRLREPCAPSESLGCGGLGGGGPHRPPSLRSSGAGAGPREPAVAAADRLGGGSRGTTPPVPAAALLDLEPSLPPRHGCQRQEAAGGGDPRAASFVRLNGFLLRTHITSLISALAEDGWLEAWEKDRLCRHAREDSETRSLTFLRVYMRFMETEDVRSFVAGLRAQIT